MTVWVLLLATLAKIFENCTFPPFAYRKQYNSVHKIPCEIERHSKKVTCLIHTRYLWYYRKRGSIAKPYFDSTAGINSIAAVNKGTVPCKICKIKITLQIVNTA